MDASTTVDPIAALRPIYRNPDRASGETCAVCTTPTEYPTCWPCRQHRQMGLPLADLVVPLTYATKQSQAYTDVSVYKQLPSGPQVAAAKSRLLQLFYASISRHVSCLVANEPIRFVTHVPSTSGRPAPHPIDEFAQMFASDLQRISLRYAGVATEDRNARRLLNPAAFEVASGVPTGGHVLVLDDSWVTGGHAQSVAGALKSAGASMVTIVTLARVLDTNYDQTRDYLAAHPKLPYNPDICPVHGVDHSRGHEL